MYRAAKRDANERRLITYLERCGAQVKQLDDPSVPDLLVSWCGFNLLMEVKGEKGTLTVAQKAFFDIWGGQRAVVRTIKDVKNVLRSIGMPAYTYKCKECTEEVIIVHSIYQEAQQMCPKCGKNSLVRIITSVPVVIYRGEGWVGKTTK